MRWNVTLEDNNGNFYADVYDLQADSEQEAREKALALDPKQLEWEPYNFELDHSRRSVIEIEEA